jgi:hypothetical protein
MNCWQWNHKHTHAVTSMKCLQSQPPYKGKLFITKIEECGGWQSYYQVPSLCMFEVHFFEPQGFFIQTAFEIQ